MSTHRTRGSRLLATMAGLLVAGVATSGCEFEGAYDLPLPGRPVDSDQAFVITAEFTDVLNLVPRSPVKVNDVTVGEVTEVERVGWHAEITMMLQDDVKLPDNVHADIQQTSLLGEKYVSVEAPVTEEPRGQLSDGDHLGLSATGRNPEVEEVLGALAMLLNGGGIGQLKIITHELNEVMSGRQERIGHLLGELDTIVGSLDDQKQNIIDAIDAVNNLAKTLNAERETVVEAIDTMGPALTILADQHDQLITMLEELDRLGVVGTRVINGTKENLVADLRHLKPILTKLNEAGQSVPNALDLLISFPFPKEASEVVKGDYANTAIVFDINLSNLQGQFENEELPFEEVCEALPDIPIPDPDLPLPDLDDLDLSDECKELIEDLFGTVDQLCQEIPDLPLCQEPIIPGPVIPGPGGIDPDFEIPGGNGGGPLDGGGGGGGGDGGLGGGGLPGVPGGSVTRSGGLLGGGLG